MTRQFDLERGRGGRVCDRRNRGGLALASRFAVACALALATAGAGCGGGDSSGDLATPAACNPLGGANCITPFPSSIYEVDDPSSPTGRRLAIPDGALPTNGDDIAIDPAPYNQRDGFSPAAPMIIAFPGGVDGSNLISHQRYADSITDASPTVIIDMSTGERVVHFAELDAVTASTPEVQALYIRPAARLAGGTRYAVAIRKTLEAKGGGALPISEGFQALLDGRETTHPLLERARPGYEAVFAALEAQGIARDDLVVAWDFTTASDESLTRDIVAARDAAIAAMGEAGANLTFEVTSDGPQDDGSVIARRIEGTFDAPLFLTNEGSYAPGTTLVRDPNTGLPVLQGMYRIPFWAGIPACAENAPEPIPVMLYGHGLLGTGAQALSGAVRTTANEICAVTIGTDMRGMSTPDVPNVLITLNDLNKADQTFGVQVQGIINHIALQHIVRGPMAETLFVDAQGVGITDPTKVVFYGLSQGHIFGSTFMAYDNFITRGVFGVGAANYSMMLERSLDFPTYRLVLEGSYGDPLDVALLLNLIQINWDVADPSGTVHLALTGGIPGTPPKQMLLHMAIADEQVPNVATEWQARTMGLPVLSPAVYEPFGVPEQVGPITGSALVIYDGGVAPPPVTNEPAPDTGQHNLTRVQQATFRQMAHFYATGEIINECDGACVCSAGQCD